jgi:integrase/recombinase XerD
MWNSYINDFKAFLRLEKSLADNSVEAYISDISKFVQFLEIKQLKLQPVDVELSNLEEFIQWINELGMSARTQARVISGIKAFYKFLIIDDLTDKDPTALLLAPHLGRKLPDILSIEEIDALIGAIDLSTPQGHRNKAIIEVLYSCGLRVSELVNLNISNIHFDQAFIRVIGKGDKERLVPIGSKALKEINNYMPDRQKLPKIAKDSEDILFLNNRGKKLTRVMIFTIVKELALKIGLKKSISPHTFRHSFASHLVDGGADLRAVQEMLGHESIITTEIYTHLDREYLRDVIIRYHPRSLV